MAQRFKAPRGTKDILPDEAEHWLRLEAVTRRVFSLYGFREIRTPVLESTALFARSVGASSDIVRKEMYTVGEGEDSISLRPENTASVVRAFVEHSLHRAVAAGYPERYFYMGPMFRYERPQKGRQRQFHQIGVELLGAGEASADAETIEMVLRLLDELQVGEYALQLNSVGDEGCRPGYREKLRGWLEPHLPQLCEDCRRRYDENPMRVFDCKIEADRALLDQAPTLGESLCAPCREHFDALRSELDGYGVEYQIDPRIVRGLDYYQRTVFEVSSSALGSQNAILGGGRYDGLVAALGGPELPGFGFAIGMERLLSLMTTENARPTIDLALISLGAAGRQAAPAMVRRLRDRGYRCMTPLSERPMGAQMRRADRAGARYALFVGQDELAAGRYKLKNLGTGEQIEVTEAEISLSVED